MKPDHSSASGSTEGGGGYKMKLESPAFNLLSANPNRLALLGGIVFGSCPQNAPEQSVR